MKLFIIKINKLKKYLYITNNSQSFIFKYIYTLKSKYWFE